MAKLLENQERWIELRITNSIQKEERGPRDDIKLVTVDTYVATLVTGGTREIPPMHLMADISFQQGHVRGEESPTAAVYNLVGALKELSRMAFDMAQERGLLKGLSFEDIK